MVQLSLRRGLGDRAEISQDRVIDTPAHAVFPERQVGFEAFPVPVIGKPEIEDGLGIDVSVIRRR
jgi:hypothetical protein